MLAMATAAALVAVAPDALAQDDKPPRRRAPLARPAPATPPLAARRPRASHARRLTRSLTLGLKTFSGGVLVAPQSMAYGMEPEPEAQFELRRELFFALSRIVGEPSLRRAALTLPRLTTLRALRDSENEERARRRATFIEIEELKGTSPRPISPSLQATLASTGVILFAGGIITSRLSLPLGPNVSARPHPWPTGIHIEGTFNVP
ncbi:Hypothetical protein A7982_10808 [Minicystis rosea]|nr:Hypothetical protein A7982_10808 [Minicystis rosea]